MKRKKLFYVPGLLSLIGIPLMFILLNIKDPVQQVVLKVILPKEDKHQKGVDEFSKSTVFNSIKNKKIIRIYLEDQKYYDDEKDIFLNTARRNFLIGELEKLQLPGDTTQILQVEFGDESNYGDFVGLLNLAILYRCKRYAYTDDSFYFLANPPLVADLFMLKCLLIAMWLPSPIFQHHILRRNY